MNVAERVGRSGAASVMVARCLGAFRLQDSTGNEVPFRTRKARATLAILALQGRAMPRNKLADLLWSDRGEPQARASLRQTIFELQHLDWRGEPLLAVGRGGVSMDRGALVTDLELIRSAAATGDWPRLLTLLESSDAGLLADLDGLDPELDDWLRLQRAHEPAKTIAAAVEAAERCADEGGARAALDLVAEILRIDPLNEEATRLAMRFAHRIGDSVALHRHFGALRDRMREDYGADPSPETVDLLQRLSAEKAKRRGSAAAAEALPQPPSQTFRRKLPRAWFIGIAALALFAIVMAAYRFASERALARSEGPILVAVLPFEQQPAGDRFLADGLWEDTRIALSRNSALEVLGPATTRAMAGQHAAPEQYRKRLGVDYILEGNVRRDGDQVLVAVSLTRTADGVSIWDHAFRGRLGDPLALQEAVAKGIEGQLRGRLAQGGGRRAEQIATSPEVYSLYSEGRSILRERTPGSGRRAQVLLQKAVSLDPNYAPAWAALAETYHFTSMRSTEAAGPRDAALADARRALALAPNLAEAHAAYAFFVGINSVQGERELRLAVALDPGHVEAWNWLGNALNAQYRPREAVAAYEKAVAADPMWLPAVANLGQTYSDLGDQKAFDALAARVQRAGGSEDLMLALRTNNAAHRGDLSGAVAPVLRFRSRSGGCDFACYEASLALIQLGYDSEAVRLGGFGESFGPLLRGDALPAASFRGAPVGPQDFWLSSEYSGPAVRALINLGHERDVIQRYRAAFGTTDQAIDQLTASGLLTALAPAVAVALCDSAQRGEAAYLLTTAARPLESVVASDRGQRAARFDLARIRAAQGRSGDALQLLEGSVGAGWLPDGLSAPMDIGQDPAFRALRGDARFEAMRKRILDHVAKERAELGPVRI